MHKFLIVLFTVGIFSCKEKTSHQDALNYYVTIRLQTKEVTNLVKAFSPQFSKIINEELPSKTNNRLKEIESFKKSNSILIQQISERLIVLNELSAYRDGMLIQFWAENYIKDTRKFLFRISKIISEKKYAANSDIQKKRFLSEFKNLEMILNLDSKYLELFSKEYKKKYQITNSELSKYAL